MNNSKKFLIMMVALFLCVSSTVVGAAEDNAIEENETGEEVKIKTLGSCQNENETLGKTNNTKMEKTDNDNLTSSNGVFIDTSDAYDQLNEFRTQTGIWYWNSDDTTKTVFNTNNENKLSPLIRDLHLEETAKNRAKEIVQLFSHTRPDGSRCFTIYPDDLMAMGENIAYGQKTCLEVTNAWKEDNDPYSGQGHRRNMLSKNYNCVGIAGFKVNGITYWVQAFGYDSTPTKVSKIKLKPKILAKNKSFKAKTKTKKYSIKLKYGKNPIKKVKVTLKIKKKTYKATTDKNGKATFKIKKFVKKGTYKALIKFNGNTYYKSVSKKVKIKIR